MAEVCVIGVIVMAEVCVCEEGDCDGWGVCVCDERDCDG
jgi:hypothetical protein